MINENFARAETVVMTLIVMILPIVILLAIASLRCGKMCYHQTHSFINVTLRSNREAYDKIQGGVMKRVDLIINKCVC